MALSLNTNWIVLSGGSDTSNAGCFDPGQTAGMYTDGAATVATSSAPVFTSASYNFVAGDVGAWLFIASGTNWTPGFYQIASVASNAATLTATAASGVLYANNVCTGLTTAVGCATTASPSSATWSINYSWQTSAQVSFTDLVSAGTGLTVSSVAHPFNKQWVGNGLVITSGTNFNAGTYVIASIGALNVATVVGAGNITTGAGASGVGGLGGALATPGQVGVKQVAGNDVHIGHATYTNTSNTSNVSGGRYNPPTFSNTKAPLIRGFNTIPTDGGTPPTIQASAANASCIFFSSATVCRIENLILDGRALGGTIGINSSSLSYMTFKGVQCINHATGFAMANLIGNLIGCYAASCTTTGFNNNSACNFHSCVAKSCGVGFTVSTNGSLINCVATGSTTYGFSVSSNGGGLLANCLSYGSGNTGFYSTSLGYFPIIYVNCYAEGNTSYGFGADASTNSNTIFLNCGAYQATPTNNLPELFIGFLTLTGTAFNGASSSPPDFTLNNIAGQGAVLRGAGYSPTLLGLATGSISYPDVGPYQHQSVAGGLLPVPLTGGIIG